ncbi:ATP-binding protein, partial [Streptomyces sp. TRM76130]|nr:ATP-binding protein [Streptomyces sp. TRM76130]
PRRRRGRTLAEAERTRLAQHPAAPRTPPTREESKARVARFSSFRQAVRGPSARPAPATSETPEGIEEGMEARDVLDTPGPPEEHATATAPDPRAADPA